MLDFFPLSQQGDQVSGLLVAAVTETIEQIISTLDRVKLRAVAVDLTAFGLARATARLAPADAAVATVYVGDHTTQVVVARGGVPHFVRILPIDVPTAAAQRHVTSPEPLIDELVPMATTRSRGALRSASSPIVGDLAARLRSTVAFYATRPNAHPISQVFVTGAGASIEGLLPALTAAIDEPIAVISTRTSSPPSRLPPATSP